MIINFPTGLYSTKLPVLASDRGNVTFVISNEIPSRTNLVYPKVPQAIIEKPKRIRDKALLLRRPSMGELVFTVAKTTRAEVGNSERIYETGQILEFNEVPIKSIDPMLVADKTEIQHNVTRINYDGLELSDADLVNIQSNSLTAYEKLNLELNQIREDRKNNEQIILTNQKIINDANRTINALTVINGTEFSQDIADLIIKMEQKKATASNLVEQAVILSNELAARATDVQDQIRAIATVVK